MWKSGTGFDALLDDLRRQGVDERWLVSPAQLAQDVLEVATQPLFRCPGRA